MAPRPPMGNPGSATVMVSHEDFQCFTVCLQKLVTQFWSSQLLLIIYTRHLHKRHVIEATTVADPGFPTEGAWTRWGCMDLQYFLANMCAKTKDLDPVGGACAGTPPKSANALVFCNGFFSNHVSSAPIGTFIGKMIGQNLWLL